MYFFLCFLCLAFYSDRQCLCVSQQEGLCSHEWIKKQFCVRHLFKFWERLQAGTWCLSINPGVRNLSFSCRMWPRIVIHAVDWTTSKTRAVQPEIWTWNGERGIHATFWWTLPADAPRHRCHQGLETVEKIRRGYTIIMISLAIDTEIINNNNQFVWKIRKSHSCTEACQVSFFYRLI